MSRLFNRVATVRVRTTAEDVSLAGLRVKFDVRRDIGSTPNSAKIQIFNLSRATAARVEDAKIVFLDVGYEEDEESLAFKGNVTRVSTRRDKSEIVTEFEAGDGTAEESEPTTVEAQPGSGTKDLVSALIAGKALSEPTALDGFRNDKLEQGAALSGGRMRLLRGVLADQGYTVSVQNGELQILKTGEARKEDAVVVSYSTGLLVAQKTEQGVKLKTLLNPRFWPGRKLKVDGRDVQGVFVCEKVGFQGDTHGDEWFADVEAYAASTAAETITSGAVTSSVEAGLT